MPAYNAATTLEKTYSEIPFDIVDDVVLTDDLSQDSTREVARSIGITEILEHETNLGYGGNQKSCYNKALEMGADIIVMLHPDFQYTPKLITAMASLIATNLYPIVLGSRILGQGALKGGMPLYKYVANRFLTFIQNLLLGQKLSEYHTGYRAYSRQVLESIDFNQFNDDFIFDNEFLVEATRQGYDIAEITCPTAYFDEASSINFRRSMKYGFGVLNLSFQYFFTNRLLRKNKTVLISSRNNT